MSDLESSRKRDAPKSLASDPTPTLRNTRHQGAIVRDHHILLLRGLDHLEIRTFWLFPGGGREPDESEQECVRREMLEETLLEVKVEKLLLDDDVPPGGFYKSVRTYLCTPVAGTAGPGIEPEAQDLGYAYSIEEVRWFDLRDEANWGEAITSDDITFPLLQRVRVALGYTSD